MIQDSPVFGLGYVVIGADNAADWQNFAEGLLGLMASKLPLPQGCLAFRMDDRMARIIVHPGGDDVGAVGWEVRSQGDWEDLQHRLDHAGITSKHLTGEEAYQRGVSELLRITDPAGSVTEFAFMPMLDTIDRFVSPTGVRFVTGDQGMGHITRAVANYQETVEFYVETLGFQLRETIDKKVRATFSSPNPRQHSIALIDGHGENHFHHVMLEVDSIDDVGRCLDRVLKGEAPLTVGLGKHFNDKMTSFYMATPSGIQIEYGFGGLRVDMDEWVQNTQGGVGGSSLWGHHPVKGVHVESVAEGFERASA